MRRCNEVEAVEADGDGNEDIAGKASTLVRVRQARYTIEHVSKKLAARAEAKSRRRKHAARLRSTRMC
jgi:hypothetical protein